LTKIHVGLDFINTCWIVIEKKQADAQRGWIIPFLKKKRKERKKDAGAKAIAGRFGGAACRMREGERRRRRRRRRNRHALPQLLKP
jgi:hypothetical protein